MHTTWICNELQLYYGLFALCLTDNSLWALLYFKVTIPYFYSFRFPKITNQPPVSWRKRERHQPGMELDRGSVYPSALSHPVPPPFGSGSPYELQNAISGAGTPNGLDTGAQMMAPTLANALGSAATHSNPSSTHSHANSPIVTLPNPAGMYGAPDYFGNR